MTSHTKPPWHPCDSSDCGDPYCDGIYDEEGYGIFSSLARSKEEVRANRELAALAPELLEALKEAVEIFWTLYSWEDRERFRKHYPDHWIVRSETLVDKVEGS